MSMFRALPLLLGLLCSCRAEAEELEAFCVDRPGLGTPDCTIDAGHAAMELGLVDWTHGDGGAHANMLVLGELLVRYGIGPHLEAQVGWEGLGIDRQRIDGGTFHQTGAGDVHLAIRYAFGDPDRLSAAIMPFATLPTGTDPLGAGDWTAGLILPVEYALPGGLELDFTGELDSAANAGGSGHHLAYSGTFGLGLPLGDQVMAAFELQASRDEDALDKSGALLGGLSLAWMPTGSIQLDAGAVVGLGRRDPAIEFYAGIARRF